MKQAPPPLGDPIGGAPPESSQHSVLAGDEADVDYVIDLRTAVATPYGGRLADLEAILQHW